MRNLRLEGKYVYLDEVQPKYFPYIIEWRNNPENNKYLNQPFKLTMELQTKWYQEKYLKNYSQGLFVMVDKSTNTPFGTIGWTDYNPKEKICIAGRALVGNPKYRSTREMTEGYLVFQDFIYEKMYVDIVYIHVANENKKVISLNKRWGYVPNTGKIRFPNELLVNGMHQTEYIRSFEQYGKARKKIIQFLELM